MSGPRRPARRGSSRPGGRAGRVIGLARRRAPRGAEVPPEQAARDRAARRTTLTGRAAILAAVVAVLGISLAYPLRQYVSQRAEINRLEEQLDERRERVDELTAQRERWEDPAYVKAQARERLHFCMPHETCYVTVESSPTPPTDSGPTPGGDGATEDPAGSPEADE